MSNSTQKHPGSCHCGDVRFEVDLDLAAGGTRCNCSICMKTASTNAIVKPNAFTLLSDEAKLSSYVWRSETAKRSFCKRCGVHCFGRGHLEQLGGDFVSVNLNCLDDADVNLLKVVHWDGRHDNWQAGPRPEPWPVQA